MRYKFILSSIHHLWLSLLFLAICWWGLLLWFFCDILKFSFSDLFPFEFSLVKLFLFEIQLFCLNLFSLLFLLFVILCSLLKDLLINSLNAFIIAIWSPYPVLHIYVLVGAFWNSVTGFCLGCILLAANVFVSLMNSGVMVLVLTSFLLLLGLVLLLSLCWLWNCL